MKKFISTLLISLFLLCSNAYAITTVYTAKALTGGGATALDFFDGDNLNDDDLAFVSVSNAMYEYRLEATSGATESSPNIIAPDTNPGNKRWLLQTTYGTDYALRNLLINGGQRQAQRGESGSATFDATTSPLNSDDTYLLDRFYILSDGNDIIDVTQQTLGGVSGQEAYVRLDIETAQKKFAYCQIVENKNLKGVIGQTASVSAEIQVSNATRLSDIRMVVLSFNEGIDTVTSDWVSAWAAEGAVPTPIANVTAENVAADLSVTTSWVRYEIENISIDTAGTDNVAACIYQNNVATASATGDFLEITNFQLEKGAVSTDFEYRDVGHELSLCQRYYAKSYAQGVVPGTATADGTIEFSMDGLTNADYNAFLSASFPVTMAGAPTVTTYDEAGTSGKWSATADGLAATVQDNVDSGFTVTGARGTASTTKKMAFNYTAEIEL